MRKEFLIGIVVIVVIIVILLIFFSGLGDNLTDGNNGDDGETLCNFNQICESGESENTCPGDCVGCITEGSHLFEQHIGAFSCCEGLERLQFYANIEKGCEEFSVGNYVCSNCGNGSCEDWENICNCLADCENQTE